MVNGFVVAHWCDADPEVPVQICWDGEGIGGRREEFISFVPGDTGPRVHFFDFADEAFADDAGAEAVLEVGMDLVTHLGDDLGSCGVETHLAGFPNRVGEGFLTVHVFAAPDGLD